MKTEIYRISEIMETLLAHQPFIDVPYEKINDIAIALVQAGYGNVSEYEAEIKRLKAENEQSRRSGILGNNVTVEFHDDVVSEQSEQSVDYNDIEKYAKQFSNRIIYINEKEIKQAQIDVLNKAKERCDLVAEELEDEIDLYGSSAAYSCAYEIEKLIEEVEK